MEGADKEDNYEFEEDEEVKESHQESDDEEDEHKSEEDSYKNKELIQALTYDMSFILNGPTVKVYNLDEDQNMSFQTSLGKLKDA